MNTEWDRVTAAAVARRAGVGRAAVSNWRRRHPDFPEPVENGPSPLFSWSAVEKWLVATGKADQLTTAGRTDTGTQRVDEPDATRRSPADLLAGAMVALLPAPADGEQAIVLDPALADPALLLAAADRFGDGAVLAGQGDEQVGRRAAALLAGHDHEVRAGDALADDHGGRYRGRATAAVCLPPVGRSWPASRLVDDPRWRFGVPDAADSELAWVQHCLAQLRPRGVAVVGVSAQVATRPSGGAVRARLVREGALHAVIGVPAVLGVDQLWVLRPPDGLPPPGVRVADLSALADAADVPQDHRAWQHLLDGAPLVAPLDLLDGDVPLLPARFLVSTPEAGELAALVGRLRTAHREMARVLPHLDGGRPPAHDVVTLAELERIGALAIRPRGTTPIVGDVVVHPAGRHPTVSEGDERATMVIEVIAIDRTRLDAGFVAMFLRTGVGASPVASTLGVPRRDDLRRCRIPRLPLAEQRRYGAAFRRLLDVREAVERLASVTSGVLDQTIHALTSGALAPKLSMVPGTIGADPSESETS